IDADKVKVFSGLMFGVWCFSSLDYPGSIHRERHLGSGGLVLGIYLVFGVCCLVFIWALSDSVEACSVQHQNSSRWSRPATKPAPDSGAPPFGTQAEVRPYFSPPGFS